MSRGIGGGGVRLKEQKGPRHSPHPWSRREGDLTWEPSRLPGLEWAGQMPSSPLLLLPEGPSHLPLLISPASLLYPQDQCGQGGGVALEGRGPAWELSRLTVLEWAGQTPSLLSSFSQRVPLACLSWSPQPQERQSCLASTSPPLSVPPHPTCSLWGSSHLLGRQSPPPVADRHPSCGEMLTPHLSTPPSWLPIHNIF